MLRLLALGRVEFTLHPLLGLLGTSQPLAGGFQFWASCGNDINALASDGDQLFAADVGGTIWRFEVVALVNFLGLELDDDDIDAV